MSIDFNRGSNPTITITVKDITLVPTLTETISEEEVIRHSYATIRREPCSESAIDASKGELQMVMDSTGTVEDEMGNVFTVAGTYASLKLNRSYTKSMDCGVYFLQFNLIDSDGNMFAVSPQPFPMKVLPNQAVFE